MWYWSINTKTQLKRIPWKCSDPNSRGKARWHYYKPILLLIPNLFHYGQQNDVYLVLTKTWCFFEHIASPEVLPSYKYLSFFIGCNISNYWRLFFWTSSLLFLLKSLIIYYNYYYYFCSFRLLAMPTYTSPFFFPFLLSSGDFMATDSFTEVFGSWLSLIFNSQFYCNLMRLTYSLRRPNQLLHNSKMYISPTTLIFTLFIHSLVLAPKVRSSNLLISEIAPPHNL